MGSFFINFESMVNSIITIDNVRTGHSLSQKERERGKVEIH